ncbi:MAG: hypothetical protein N2Z72_05385 [Bacteroidales bacterium]|nr:hypothetical protein [Bacteroidales bacterium]
MMKKFFLLLSCLICIYNCSRTREDAVKFNNAVVADQRLIIESINKLVDVFQDTNYQQIEKRYVEHVRLLEEMKAKYINMQPFDDEDILRKAFMDFIDTNYRCAKNEYARLIDILKMTTEKTYWDNKKKWDSIAHLVQEKEQRINEKFLEAQKKFAEKYDITLVVK